MFDARIEMRSLGWIVLSTALMAGCEKQENPLPDAEAIQKVGQAVLAAPDKARARAERASLHADLDEVRAALEAWRGMAGGAIPSVHGGASVATPPAQQESRREIARKAVLEELKVLRHHLEGYASSEHPAAAAWRFQAYARAAGRIEAMIVEVTGTTGRASVEQFAVADALLKRLQVQHAPVGPQSDDTPTMSALTKHR